MKAVDAAAVETRQGRLIVTQRRSFRLRTGRGAATLVTAFLFLISLPVVLGSYGRLDDYSQLVSVQEQGPLGLVKWSLSFGRPVNFIVNALLLDVAQSIEGLRLLRLVAASGIALAAWVLARAAASEGDAVWSQVCVPALVFALPGSWVFIAWGQGAGHAAALVFAASCVFLALREPKVQGSAHLAHFGIGAVLICAAMFSYQPLGLAIPGLILACGLLGGRPRVGRRAALLAAPVVVLAFSANVALVRMSGSAEIGARTRITSDWEGKTEWILRELLPRVFWPFSLTANFLAAAVTVAIAILLLSYTAVAVRREGRLQVLVQYVLVAAALVLLPIAPLVAIEENWASSRSVLAAALVTWLLMMALIKAAVMEGSDGAIPGQNPRGRASTALLTAWAAFLLVAATFSAYRAYVGLTAPSVAEWQQAKSSWAGAPPSVSSARVQLEPLVVPDIPYVSYDEYGVRSGGVSWSAAAMHALAAREVADLDLSPGQVIISTTTGSCQSAPLATVSPDHTTLLVNPMYGVDCSNGN